MTLVRQLRSKRTRPRALVERWFTCTSEAQRLCATPLRVLLLAAACTATTPPEESVAKAAQADAPQQAAPAGDDVFLVGVLDENGVAECPDGGDRKWAQIEPVIGWTKVTIAEAPPRKLFGTAVVARGGILDAARQRSGSAVSPECPQMQMRSDWMETPSGIRLEREPSTAGPHVRVDNLRPLSELSATEVDGKLAVELRNPVPVELADVTLVVHYEGCHGKPGATQRSQVHGALPVGAGMRASFPAIVEAERAPSRLEPHRAMSLQILAKSDRAFFDLDVRVSSLGATVECPSRD